MMTLLYHSRTAHEVIEWKGKEWKSKIHAGRGFACSGRLRGGQSITHSCPFPPRMTIQATPSGRGILPVLQEGPMDDDSTRKMRVRKARSIAHCAQGQMVRAKGSRLFRIRYILTYILTDAARLADGCERSVESAMHRGWIAYIHRVGGSLLESCVHREQARSAGKWPRGQWIVTERYRGGIYPHRTVPTNGHVHTTSRCSWLTILIL